MTKQLPSAGERARRRELVTLSVVASSALALAATWVGIAATDGSVTSTTVMAPVPSAAPADANASSGALVQVPVQAPLQSPVQRPVTVIRRSRAS